MARSDIRTMHVRMAGTLECARHFSDAQGRKVLAQQCSPAGE